MLFLCLNQIDACALPMVLPIVPNPGLPKYLFPKATLVFLTCIAKAVLSIGIIGPVLIIFKCMSGGAQTNHRSGPAKILVKMLHLFGWQSKETHEKDQSICFLQNFEARDIGYSCFNFSLISHSK